MAAAESAEWIVFADRRQLARGEPATVAEAVRAAARQMPTVSLLVFDTATGQQVDVDLRAATANAPAASPAGKRGRPRLGVVAREVTLLPRHWDWLQQQRGGASATLRRLVDEARHADAPRQQARASAEAAYRFMTAIAGDLPGYEEACRALFAGQAAAFADHLADWPDDIRRLAGELAGPALRPN